MSPEAVAENRACEAVVKELSAMLVQAGAPPVIRKLCDEIAGRIYLRRKLAQIDDLFDERTSTKAG